MACGMAGLHCSPSFMARTSYDPLQFRFSRFSDIPPRYLHIQTKLDSFTKEVPEIKQHYIINILYRFNNLYCALDPIFDVPTLFPPWFQLPDLKKKKHPSNEWSRKACRNLPVVGQPPRLPPVMEGRASKPRKPVGNPSSLGKNWF